MKTDLLATITYGFSDGFRKYSSDYDDARLRFTDIISQSNPESVLQKYLQQKPILLLNAIM